MITDKDVAKLRKAFKSDFDNLEKKIDKKLDEKLAAQSSEIKQYIHEGVSAVVKGVDNLLNEYQFDSRIKSLEKIHPSGRHRSLN